MKKINSLLGRRPRLSLREEHNIRLRSSVDGAFGLHENHAFLAALKYYDHPLMQIYLDERISNIKNDLHFLDDLFDLAVKIDRDEYERLLERRKSKRKILCPSGARF